MTIAGRIASGAAEPSPAPAPAPDAPSSAIAAIAIRGGGVGAHCCHHLLAQAGLAARLEAPPPGATPAILLG
ncbi:hypothetical protein MTR62_14025, partial [Novosphingobium sp. 1949]|nr:hypothetical protein [Novosphingobium organovorum]